MEIKGKDKFLAQLASLPRIMREEIRKALDVSADETTDIMKRMAPREQGKLAASIGYSFDGAPAGASIVSQARAAKGETGLAVTMYAGNESTVVTNSRGVRFQNARLQEFGTKDMPRNPFFYPAFRLNKKRAKSRIQRAIRSGAQKAFR